MLIEYCNDRHFLFASVSFEFVWKIADNYAYDEIQAALTHCGDGNPIAWLEENWSKLIETVQTLATKYGQERKENIVGTISAIEAREALKKHKGNVWHAVTECIEQRQKSFNFINSQGKYLREDIVTYLTVHHGDRELALRDLSRLQLKPFLLNVIGAPAGVDNDSGNYAYTSSEWAFPTDDAASVDAKDAINGNQSDMLKDLETIIGNMEQKQSKQTETILSTIENLLGNMVVGAPSHRPPSSASNFSMASYDRLDVKSPILVQPKESASNEEDVETEVKNFMSRHIQDIVPDVAAMVDKELHSTQTDVNVNDDIRHKLAALAAIEEQASGNMTKVAESSTEDGDYHQTSELKLSPALQEVAEELVQDTTTEQLADQQLADVRVDAKIPEPPANEADTLKIPKSSNHIKFVINKAFAKRRRQHYDKAVIRALEKQLLKKERMKRTSKEIPAAQTTDTDVSQASSSIVIAENMIETSNMVDDMVDHGHGLVAEQLPENIQNSTVVEQQSALTDEMEFSMIITEQGQADADEVDLSRLSPSPSNSLLNNITLPADVPSVSAAKAETAQGAEISQRNLSDLFQDTKNLIQQMKNEIDEDIAMSVSEFDEDTEYYETDSDEYSDYSGEDEELESQEHSEEEEIEYETEEETENAVDGEDDTGEAEEWMDTDEEGDENEEFTHVHELEQNVIPIDRDSDSSDSETFAEAHEIISNSLQTTTTNIEADSINANPIGVDEMLPQLESVESRGTNDGYPTASNETESRMLENLEQNILEIQQSFESSTLSMSVGEQLHPGEQSAEVAGESTEEIVDESIVIVESAESFSPIEEADSVTNTEDASVEANEQRAPAMDILIENPTTVDAAKSTEPNEGSVVLNVPEKTRPSVSPGRETLVESYTYKRTTIPVMNDCSRSPSSINVLELQATNIDPIPLDVFTEPPLAKSDSQKSLKKNKIPVRKNSMPGTSTIIQNIQNELIKKQEKLPEKNTGKKPSKIVPPKVYLKSIIAKSTEIMKPLLPEKKTHPKLETLADPKTTKSTPKKKYYETCFSDDYQTSDDESGSRPVQDMVKPQVIYKNEDIDDPEVYFIYRYMIHPYD